ncbi:MAG TPA: hypothetical protein VK483_17880 [Chitinophagaceae bacterium]|nr:hypothetical protein [Chitinophagaceae bacterium]
MEEKNIRAFSIPALLLVTGTCFLSFALLLKILDGVIMTFFLDTGFLTFLAGVIAGVFIMIRKRSKE